MLYCMATNRIRKFPYIPKTFIFRLAVCPVKKSWQCLWPWISRYSPLHPLFSSSLQVSVCSSAERQHFSTYIVELLFSFLLLTAKEQGPYVQLAPYWRDVTRMSIHTRLDTICKQISVFSTYLGFSLKFNMITPKSIKVNTYESRSSFHRSTKNCVLLTFQILSCKEEMDHCLQKIVEVLQCISHPNYNQFLLGLDD